MTPSTPNSSSSLKESITIDKNSTNASSNNNNTNSDSLSSSFLSQLDSSSSQTLMGSSSSSTPNKSENNNKNNNKMIVAKKTHVSKLNTQNIKFQSTIDFVGIYLQNVVKLQFPFENKEQNKFTYEVYNFL